MCGIAGASLNPNDHKLNLRTASAALLRGIASRGPDATGAAWYDHDEDAVKLTKIAVNTEKFLTARKEILPETTPVIILHTRFATTGSKSERKNNHPIHHGNIVGVHNGVLWDHKGMFREMGREPLADVDSEAIFALLNGGVRPEKVLNKVEGDAAIGWIDLEDPEVLHLACVVDRPLFIAQTAEGSLMFASTKAAIQDAAKACDVTLEYEHEVEQGKYLKVVGGIITEYLPIPGVKSNAAWANRYSWTSGRTTTPTITNTSASRKPDAPTAKELTDTVGDTWEYSSSAKRYVKVEKQTPAQRAKAAKQVKKADETWTSRKTSAELVRIAKNGNQYAIAELLRRGYNRDGVSLRIPTTSELVQMCKRQGGHQWAENQLRFQNLDRHGKPVLKINDMSMDELVVLAGGGSQAAVKALAELGLDRTGSPLLSGSEV